MWGYYDYMLVAEKKKTSREKIKKIAKNKSQYKTCGSERKINR
jgi:hypothetical protein